MCNTLAQVAPCRRARKAELDAIADCALRLTLVTPKVSSKPKA